MTRWRDRGGDRAHGRALAPSVHAVPPPRAGAPAHEETPKQRRDRELIELLNELRLASPGVQVLFGFLLIVPFNSRFGDTSDAERTLYVISLLFTAAATVLLIGASVQHRLLFRRHFERRMLVAANLLSLVGLSCMGVALVAALLFLMLFIFGPLAAVLTGSFAGALIVVVWYVLPLVRAARDSGVDDQ